MRFPIGHLPPINGVHHDNRMFKWRMNSIMLPYSIPINSDPSKILLTLLLNFFFKSIPQYRPMGKKLTTKEKIILEAVRMYNEFGAQNVTSRHIAAEIGISHGNL